MKSDLRSELERGIPDSEVPSLPLEAIKKRGRWLSRRRKIGLALAGSVSIALVAAISMAVVDADKPTPSDPALQEDFFAALRAVEDKHLSFSTLESYLELSQVVVIGRFESVGQGRVIGDPDGDRGALETVLVRVQPSELVTGELAKRDREIIELELANPRDVSVDELESALPDEDVLLILRDITDQPQPKIVDESGFEHDPDKSLFTLPTPKGLFIEEDERVITPLDESRGQFDEKLDVGSLGELADHIRGISESVEPTPRLIGDHVVSIHPDRVRSGDQAELRITDPPGTYGLAWNLGRREGDRWEYVGGYKAGPKEQWEGHERDRFYFLPEWRNIGIEDIGFQGPASIPIEIPKLDPGKYRLTGEFEPGPSSDKDSSEWHYVNFEVVE